MLPVTALTLGTVLVLAGPARAAEPMQVSGKNTCKVAEQHAIPVEGDPDHVLAATKGTCSISAAGPGAMFDGGQFTWVETGDYAKGTGSEQGYFLGKYKDGSTGFFTYAGTVVTAMVDGKPHTTFQGTYEMKSGTNQLANAQFKGTYNGEPISATESVSEWEGTLTEGSKQ